MDFIQGFFNTLWAPSLGESLPKKRPREVETSLNGRDTPIDLVEKGTFRIASLKKATYSVNPDKTKLTINLPKRGSKKRRKNYVMDYYSDMDALAEAIQKEMDFDKFKSMDSVRMAAEYPNFFWNGMFHCLGKIDVFDRELKKRNILCKTRKRIKTEFHCFCFSI